MKKFLGFCLFVCLSVSTVLAGNMDNPSVTGNMDNPSVTVVDLLLVSITVVSVKP